MADRTSPLRQIIQALAERKKPYLHDRAVRLADEVPRLDEMFNPSGLDRLLRGLNPIGVMSPEDYLRVTPKLDREQGVRWDLNDTGAPASVDGYIARLRDDISRYGLRSSPELGLDPITPERAQFLQKDLTEHDPETLRAMGAYLQPNVLNTVWHEGRHRANAIGDLGHDKMPTRLWLEDSILPGEDMSFDENRRLNASRPGYFRKLLRQGEPWSIRPQDGGEPLAVPFQHFVNGGLARVCRRT